MIGEQDFFGSCRSAHTISLSFVTPYGPPQIVCTSKCHCFSIGIFLATCKRMSENQCQKVSGSDTFFKTSSVWDQQKGWEAAFLFFLHIFGFDRHTLPENFMTLLVVREKFNLQVCACDACSPIITWR